MLKTSFEIKEYDAVLLSVAYQPFGTPLSQPCYGAIISNESTVPVYISVDGITKSFRVGKGMIFEIYAMPRHKTLVKGEYLLNKGTQLYIKHNYIPGKNWIVFNALMIE